MSGLQRHRRRLGSLDCVVVDLAPQPTRAVIFCHGFGAPGDDLVSLADALSRQTVDPYPRLRFVFPFAPLQPPELAPFGGRAWWNLNMAALLAAAQADSFEQLQESVPPGIELATEGLVSCIEATLKGLSDLIGEASAATAELAAAGLTDPGDAAEAASRSPRYVLGGFSQGAMLATHVALSGRVPPPDLLVQFSGTLICRSIWQAGLDAGRLSDTEVLQSHGTIDDILPFAAAQKLRHLIEPHCKAHTFIPFTGPHTIPAEAFTSLAGKL